MKGTRHNGRSGKNGVYNPLHNDRRFNPEHSEHIDNERVRQNIYWDCYQGYTTMEDKGKENNFSFEQIELAFYEEHYGNYVMKQNERHVKARHPDRCKEVEDVWKNKKTCPEESIYQLGTIDEHASVETLILVFDEFKKEFDERFGSNVHIIDWSLHMDEATPHIHSLLQQKTKVKVVNEIKEKARPSIMSRLAEKKKELAEREANKKNDLKKSWNRDDR